MKELENKLKRKIGALAVIGIFFLIAFIPISLAAPNWTETGGDINDAGSYYIDVDADSTDADHDEVFAVTKHGGSSVGTELFRVQEDGRVGVNDDSPDFKLEVTGSSGSGYFGVTSSSPPNFILSGIQVSFF